MAQMQAKLVKEKQTKGKVSGTNVVTDAHYIFFLNVLF
jgi:hypothetical protein